MEGHAQLPVLLPIPVRRQIGQAAEARFALAQRLLRPLALGDIRSYATVAVEIARRVVNRHAIEGNKILLAIFADSDVLEILERLVRLEHGAMIIPRAGQWKPVGLLPAKLAEQLVGRCARALSEAA